MEELRTWIGNPRPPQNHLLWFKCLPDNCEPDPAQTSNANIIENGNTEPSSSLGVILFFSESPLSERDKSSLRFPTTAYSLEELSIKMAAAPSDPTSEELEKDFVNCDFEELLAERFGSSGEGSVRESRVFAVASEWPA
jgi:hypothetical protein